MGAKRRLDRQKICDLWKQEYSIAEIAAETGANSTSVAQILRDAGLYSGKSKVDKGKIRALRKAGWNISAIAHEMWLPAETIKGVLNEA